MRIEYPEKNKDNGQTSFTCRTYYMNIKKINIAMSMGKGESRHGR